MKIIVTSILSLFLLFLFNYNVNAQQQFKWVKGGGTTDPIPSGAKDEAVYYMCTDPNGNVYALSVVGANPIKADTFSHSACGYHNNILLTSYKCDGTMRWAKLINGSGDDIPLGIATDDAGHVYVSGSFDHTAGSHYFEIGYDTTISGYYYLLNGLIQLDTNGHYNWIRFMGTNTLATLAGMSNYAPLAIDGSKNIHQFPYVRAGVAFMTGVTSIGGVYDLTYNPSGTLLSAVRLDMDSQWECKSAVIDPVSSKLYISGEINQYIFGGFLTDTFYAAAFDVSRHKLWQYFCGNGGGVEGITFDQSKHLYFPGGTDGSPFTFNGASVSAGVLGIVMKTDTNGTVNWIDRFAATTSVNALVGITALPNNKVAAIGGFAGKITNDAGTYTFVTPTGEGQNAYMVIVDSAGDVQYMDQIHGNGFYDWGWAITSDKKGNIYLGGEVEDSIWGLPKIPAYHSVGGNTDFFVMKYGVDCSCTTMPVSAFTYFGTHTLSVTYTGTGTSIDSVVWNFGDGSPTVKGLTAVHTYTLAGTYRVTATVYTPCGNDIHGEDVVILCGLPPTAAFTASGFHTISFAYTGTTSTVDSTVWNFGDGSPTAKGSTASHTYAAIGVYTVCVTAWSVCGNNTACKTVTVTCVSAPTSSFTFSGVHTISVTYTGTTTALDSVVWDFGDGSATVKGLTTSHTYAAIGTYTICATAYSACGSNTACNTVTIPCIAAPSALFTDTGHITVGTIYTGTSVPLDSIVWYFGDGSSEVKGTTAIHSYTAVGIYHICVTAYNPCGNNSYCFNDTVRCITAPVVSFSDTGTNKNTGFVYTGTTAGIDSIVWDFGDGTKDTGAKPVHTYSVYGTYRVCATVYTPCGVDSSCSTINVHPVGLSDPALPDIRVFPNPANDALTITGIEENTDYRLLTVTGICIAHGEFYAGSNIVYMQNCAPGIYILEMTGLNGKRNNVRVVKE